MADYDLGTARGRIEIDASGAVKGVSEANKAQMGLGKSATDTSGALLVMGGAMTAVGAAAVGGFALAVNAAANFEQGLSNIKAVSGATGDQMEDLRKKALQLGADTAFSAGDAAGAMEELVKAGLNVDEVLNGAADATVNLAAAGGIDLPNAATIAANAMNAFGLAASDLPKVADLIAGAANASAIDVNEFGQAMQQAGAAANLVGFDFDDLSVAIAAMGNAGIKGSDAGTSLKTFLLNLQPVTVKQKHLMEDLGLVTEEGGNQFFDAAGKVKSMSEVAGILGGALQGMTDQQKAATLEVLFGSDAIRAAAVISETGAAGMENLAASMDKVKAADVAATRMDNFKGSIEQLKGSFETLLITIGTPFLGVLRSGIDFVTKITNAISNLNPEVLKIGTYIVAAVGALVGFVGVMLTVIGMIKKFNSAISALKLGALLTNPVFLVVAALAALAAAFVIAYQRSQTFRDIVQKALDAIRPTIELIITGVHALIAAFKDPDVTSNGFVGVMERMGVAARAVFEWIQGSLLPALADFGAFITGTVFPAVNSVVEAFGGWKTVLAVAAAALLLIVAPIPTVIAGLTLLYTKVGAFRDVVNAVVGFITGTLIPAFVKFSKGVVAAVGSAFDWIRENIFPTIKALADLVVATVDRIITTVKFIAPAFEFTFAVIQVALDVLMTAIGFFIDTIVAAWQLFGDNILAAVHLAWDAIMTVVETALGLIRGVIQIVTGIISGDWSKVWQGIKTIFSTVWEGMRAVVEQIIRAIQLVISTTVDAIHLAWDTAWKAIGLVLSTMWEAMKTVVEGAIGAIGGLIENALGTIKGMWETVWGGISSFLGGVWEAISGAVSAGITGIVDFFAKMPGRVLGALGDLLVTLVQKGVDLIQGMLNGIHNIEADIWQFFTTIPGRIIGLIPNPLSILLDVGKKIIQGLWNGMKAIWNEVSGWLGGLGGVIGKIKGPPAVDARILIENGELIMQGFLVGLRHGFAEVQGMLASVAPSIQTEMFLSNGAATGTAAGGGGGLTLIRDFNQTVNGVMPGDVERETAAALRQVAAEWEVAS